MKVTLQADKLGRSRAEQRCTGHHHPLMPFSLGQRGQSPEHQLKRGKKSPGDGCAAQIIELVPHLVTGNTGEE